MTEQAVNHYYEDEISLLDILVRLVTRRMMQRVLPDTSTTVRNSVGGLLVGVMSILPAVRSVCLNQHRRGGGHVLADALSKWVDFSPIPPHFRRVFINSLIGISVISLPEING